MKKRCNCGWENLTVINSTYIQMCSDEDFIRIDAIAGYDNKVLHLMFIKKNYGEARMKTCMYCWHYCGEYVFCHKGLRPGDRNFVICGMYAHSQTLEDKCKGKLLGNQE